jgi:hypothetical protein
LLLDPVVVSAADVFSVPEPETSSKSGLTLDTVPNDVVMVALFCTVMPLRELVEMVTVPVVSVVLPSDLPLKLMVPPERVIAPELMNGSAVT